MTAPEEEPGPDVEERIQLATVLHPGCIVAGVAFLVAVWGAFGYWIFTRT